MSTLNNLFQHELLSAEDELRLIKEAQQGNKASRDRVILQNMRFIRKLAEKQLFRLRATRALDIDDMIMYGVIGLNKAIDKFDTKRGFRLTTYATTWVTEEIRRSMLLYGKLVRLPVNKETVASAIVSVSAGLEKELCRDPTPEEIVESYNTRYAKPITVEQLLLLREIGYNGVGISESDMCTDEGEKSLHQFIDDEADVLSTVERDIISKDVMGLLDTLPDREAAILKMRNGIDVPERTLEQTGKVFNITKERVRQIQNEAMKTLRIRAAIRGMK
jgi:RNA polymerase primary sigma factor